MFGVSFFLKKIVTTVFKVPEFKVQNYQTLKTNFFDVILKYGHLNILNI